MRLVVLLCLLAAPAPAQTLQPEPDLAPDIGATPRLPAATEAATRINARLAALDSDALTFRQDCVTDSNGDYFHRVEVTLFSPNYLSLLIFDASFCSGAAHPGSDITPLIFDLATGHEVDPMTWLPPRLSPGPEPQALSGADRLARFAPLTALYIATELAVADYPPDPACHDLLRSQSHGFDLWPDAATQSLVLQPTGLAYVDTPCENPVSIPLTTLKRQGFSPALLSALSP